jgi:hypothetical protein
LLDSLGWESNPGVFAAGLQRLLQPLSAQLKLLSPQATVVALTLSLLSLLASLVLQ